MAHIKRHILKTGKVRWRGIVKIAGKQQCRTFDKRGDALRWSQKLESNQYHIAHVEYSHTVADMITRYLDEVLPVKMVADSTRERQHHQLLWWRGQIGHLKLCDVTQFVIADKRNVLHARPLQPATVNHYLAALSGVFTHAMKNWAWINKNPVSLVTKPPLPPGVVRYLTPEELARLLRAARAEEKKPIYDIIVLALATGARKNELLTIKLADVDSERKRIIIHDTKNHESRGLHISGEALQIVRCYADNQEKRQIYLFEYALRHVPLTIETEWRRVRAKARLDNFRFHDLRHTFASYMAMNGESTMVISEALGHKKLEMVKRYAHLCDSHTGNAIADMTSKFIFSASPTSQTHPADA